MTFVAEFADSANERVATIFRVAIAGRREVSELAKAARDQMFECKPRAFRFIGKDGADAARP